MASIEGQRPLGLSVDVFERLMNQRGAVKDRETQSPKFAGSFRDDDRYLFDKLRTITCGVSERDIAKSKTSIDAIMRQLKWVTLLEDARQVIKIVVPNHSTVSRIIFGYRPRNRYLDIVFVDSGLEQPTPVITPSWCRINTSAFPENQAQQLTDPEVLAQMNNGRKRQYIGTMAGLK